MVGCLIALFAFVGGILRYELGRLPLVYGVFPIGTLFANYLGCFLLTALVRGILQKKKIPSIWVVGMATGFCGGLTTFSTFALDTVRLVMAHQLGTALLYLFLSILGGLFFIGLGNWFSKKEVER